MMEVIVGVFLVMTFLFLYFVWPILRHYFNYQKEKEQLEKRYNRLWRSRRDLLVSYRKSKVWETIVLTFDFDVSCRITWIGQSHVKSL